MVLPTQHFLAFLCFGLLVFSVEGGWFRRRRRTTVVQQTHVHNTNNCNCRIQLMLAELSTLKKQLAALQKKTGKRDVAAMLKLDEDYPGLEQFVDHLNSKRGLTIDEDLEEVIQRNVQSTQANGQNICNCGRSLVDQYNLRAV